MGCNCTKNNKPEIPNVSEIISNDNYKKSLIDYSEIHIDGDFINGESCYSNSLKTIPVYSEIAESIVRANEWAIELSKKYPMGAEILIRYKSDDIIKLMLVISNNLDNPPLIIA